MRKAKAVHFWGFAVAITTACGPRGAQLARPSSPDPVTKTSERKRTAHESTTHESHGAETFDELEALVKGAKVTRRFEGQVSYYADSLAGNVMAGGERYRPSMPHAAHRTLPFGTVVRVVGIESGRSVVVRITDRGPFGSKRRILDVSRAAAERLGMLRAGVIDARVEVLSFPAPNR